MTDVYVPDKFDNTRRQCFYLELDIRCHQSVNMSTHLSLHFFLFQLNQRHAREVHYT